MGAEGLSEVFVEGVEVDVFDGCGVLVVAVEFTAALGVADVDPVGGAVAGAGKALAFYEGLQKHRGVVVAGVPVVGQLFGGKGEYLGGEVPRAHPGQNEKPGVVDDEVEVLESAALILPLLARSRELLVVFPEVVPAVGFDVGAQVEYALAAFE